jgi:hypothetical protein
MSDNIGHETEHSNAPLQLGGILTLWAGPIIPNINGHLRFAVFLEQGGKVLNTGQNYYDGGTNDPQRKHRFQDAN